MQRYERQLLMKQIGNEGQDKLTRSTVVVVGCGGLGSLVLTYLACAGIGRLAFIDFDVVSETNLNRQFLHSEKDIGMPKALSAKEWLQTINSEIELIAIQENLTKENIDRLIDTADVVVDCVDNIETRILLGRECLRRNIPLIEGGVQGFYGWIMSIRPESACLECIGYENAKVETPVPIIGTTAGVVGSLQANECIKIILDIEGTLFGTMLQYDGITASLDRIEVQKNDSCKAHHLLTDQ